MTLRDQGSRARGGTPDGWRHVGLPAALVPFAVADWPTQAVANGLIGTQGPVAWPLHRVPLAGAAATVLRAMRALAKSADGLRARVVGLALPALAAVADLDGQSRSVQIADTPACTTCAVTFAVVATLGAQDGRGALDGTPLAAAQDAAGRFWMVTDRTGELPKVYSPSGTFLREIGAIGRGPGEFLDPMDVVLLPGDSVLIVDGGQRRGVVVSPTLQTAREILIPLYPRPSIVVDWPTNVWLNGGLPTGASAGWPLHRVSMATSSAELISSFGPDDGQLRPGGFDHLWQWLSTGPNAAVWSASRLRYRLTRWSPSGEPQLEYTRQPDWFKGVSRAWMGNASTQPPPAVGAIGVDSAGLVWVFIHVPAHRWREAWAHARSSAGRREVQASNIEIAKLWRTIVEVIDPARDRVLARGEIDRYIFASLPGRRAAAFHTTPDGRSIVTIVQMQLTGSPRQSW